jgi:hypothetical protein
MSELQLDRAGRRRSPAQEHPLIAQCGTPATGFRGSADGSEVGKRGLVVALSLLT